MIEEAGGPRQHCDRDPCTLQGTENSQPVFPGSSPMDPEGSPHREVCAAAQGKPMVSWASCRADACPGLLPSPAKEHSRVGFWGPGAAENRLTRVL